jgi:hypothetical protein
MFAAKKVAAALAALFISTSAALSWDATIEGPDVFGATKALGGIDNGRDSLVIQCSSDDTLHLALLLPVKEFEETPTTPATFHIQIDDGQPVALEASLRGWNKNYRGVVLSEKTAELISLVRSFGTAKRVVNVGYEVNGYRDSASFSARGSTQAIKRISDACKLNATTN